MRRFALSIYLFILSLAWGGFSAHAQSVKGLPSLPKSSGGMAGFHGSAGAGFTDFRVMAPSQDFQIERGVFVSGSIERAFNVAHLYLTLGLSYLDAQGIANYDYTNLSSSTSYSITDVPFRAKMYEISLGLKLKLIDGYWFRPYIEGGGIGSYNEVTYDSAKLVTLNATGTDYKKKDVIMGSGYYGEGGVEVSFTEKFGVRLAARQSFVQTKKLDTLNGRVLRLQNETYYVAALFGF